ncbi:MAG: hypothetical protein PHQ65_00755 [Bacteroidales bacterium]|nr:hypothetical protein [Bacteroidales bacterium]MDD3663771.1 hypothetical protein [Bacteroidales bacterium]
MDFERASTFILDQLRTGLPTNLFYHNMEHVMDVYRSVIRIGQSEKLDTTTLTALKTAALMHDAGMLKTYRGHEEAACGLVKLWLPQFNYTDSEMDYICKMILTTQLPQSASEIGEKILCDADLDYLGREDFFMIAHRLRFEWNNMGINRTTLKQWYELQIKFIEEHRYYTATNLRLREEGKQNNLEQIKILLDHR